MSPEEANQLLQELSTIRRLKQQSLLGLVVKIQGQEFDLEDVWKTANNPFVMKAVLDVHKNAPQVLRKAEFMVKETYKNLYSRFHERDLENWLNQIKKVRIFQTVFWSNLKYPNNQDEAKKVVEAIRRAVPIINFGDFI